MIEKIEAATLLKRTTKDNAKKELKYKTQKHDYDNILKSLKVDNDNYKKKYESLNKKKVFLIITETLIGGGSTIASSILSIFFPSVGIVLSSSTALLTSLAILITNEFISKLKIRYTKLRDWITVITLLFEKTLKQPMIEKKLMIKEHRN